MNLWSRIWNSSIGMKMIMGLTGLALVLFTIVHMLGNLQLFLGPHALNRYASFLQNLGELLWLMRGGLLILFVLHVICAIRVTYLNRVARPVRYRRAAQVQLGLAPRTLIYTGVLVFIFLGYHLAHFTLGATDPSFKELHDSLGRHDVHSMVAKGFGDPRAAWSYMIAMILLGYHLSHGIPNLFQSVGWNHPKYQPVLKRWGAILAILIVIGNISMPLAVQLGLVRVVAGGH
jgi:succinate dehydrogenase / fumarate reductase cytochrome b subunit